ncbi:MAG: FUSC family protein, partial [Comamonas sp.]|nr:FUSC family protein [Candidatus Comamonas equi]
MHPYPPKNNTSAPVPALSDTARHLLSWPQWRESLHLVSHPSLWISAVTGLQVALSVLLVIVAVFFSPWDHLVGFAALGGLTALFGRFAPLPERRRIVTVCALLMALAVLVPSLCALAGAAPWMLIGVLTLSVGVLTLIVSHLRLGVPGAVIIVFATGAALLPVNDMGMVVERTLATLAGGISACIVCLCTDWLRRETLSTLTLPQPVLHPLRKELVVAARITIGAGLAAFISYAAGWHHPAWAAIGATAVIRGTHLHITMSRALQRMAGTIAGAVLCWVILAHEPSFWVVVAWIVAFQFLTEV